MLINPDVDDHPDTVRRGPGRPTPSLEVIGSIPIRSIDKALEIGCFLVPLRSRFVRLRKSL